MAHYEEEYATLPGTMGALGTGGFGSLLAAALVGGHGADALTFLLLLAFVLSGITWYMDRGTGRGPAGGSRPNLTIAAPVPLRRRRTAA